MKNRLKKYDDLNFDDTLNVYKILPFHEESLKCCDRPNVRAYTSARVCVCMLDLRIQSAK